MSLPKVKGLTTEQSEAMVRLSRLPAFKDLIGKVEADDVSSCRLCWSIYTKSELNDNLREPADPYGFVLIFQQFFMWIESNTPELAVPYLWAEEKQSSEYTQIYFNDK